MAIPKTGHSDWLFGLFSWVPRKWTAVAGPPPTNVLHSANFDSMHYHPDVPNEGAWTISTHPEYGFCFATVMDGWLFSVGLFRYDYTDGYYEFPRIALKKLKRK